MAHCKEYFALSYIEQKIMIGKIAHLVANNTLAFKAVETIIEAAEAAGVLKNVKFTNHNIFKEEV